MNSPFRETYRIRSYESDLNDNVKVSSIFNYMQESASLNAEQLHFGYDDMVAKGLFWVLSRAKIVMFKYLKTWDEITVETWPKNIVKFFANRDFRFYDKSRAVIGSATTAWLMINRNNLRPVKPELHLTSLHHYSVEPGIDVFLEKIEEPDELSFSRSYKMSYKDIDINLHTNNSRYIEYLLDCYENKLVEGRKISSLQINFLNQTKSGDEINLYTGSSAFDSTIDYIEALNQDNVKVFNSIVEWM